ncbi:MAG: mismatch repair protein MutT [Haloplasmataceae bacterium]|jgi:hypothetical protein|nr:mismatch repair protein MutT [Haloplasmataceae bacterium]
MFCLKVIYTDIRFTIFIHSDKISLLTICKGGIYLFDKGMLNSFKTVGTLILYHDTLAFMIGPDKTGEKLGIVRFGGHIEDGESLLQALNREIYEDCSISVNLINSPLSFYKKDWNDNELINVTKEINFEMQPFLLKGDNNRLSALFLSKTDIEPIPSSETNGIIFLTKQNIIDICNKKITCLSEFIKMGGKLVQQNKIDINKEIYAGVHLNLVFDLLLAQNQLIIDYFDGKM